MAETPKYQTLKKTKWKSVRETTTEFCDFYSNKELQIRCYDNMEDDYLFSTDCYYYKYEHPYLTLQNTNYYSENPAVGEFIGDKLVFPLPDGNTSTFHQVPYEDIESSDPTNFDGWERPHADNYDD